MAATLSADPPRIVLFGRPGAGKSSLLGALVQAGRTQGEVLGAEVVDPSHTLASLRDHLYDAAELHDGDSEVVEHGVRLRPWRAGQKSREQQPAVVLIDCDGSAAERLLKQSASFAAGRVSSPLAQAVRGADTLLLVVSAVAGDAELDATFQDFHAFLDAIESRREWERGVGGLPVFLVLTHCDGLAEYGDTPDRWQDRIEQRKQYVLQRFGEYFTGEGSLPYLPFGSVDLEVFATAVRGPRLARTNADASEPFGVAELFRAGFASASDHHSRAIASNRRLGWTVRGAGTILGVLAAGLLAVLALRPSETTTALEDRIHQFQQGEGEAAVRLAAKNLPRNKRTLTRFRDDSAFASLPIEPREFVEDRLREIGDYQNFQAKLLSGPYPAEARGLDELERIERYLTRDLALPAEYAWGETEAARLREKWLDDIPRLREAERMAADRYRDWIRQANGFEFVSTFDGDWRPGVVRFLGSTETFPFTLTDALPGSEAMPGPRGAALTYAIPFEFDRVYQARKDWQFTRDRLANLRDLADALGLTAGPDRKPAVLDWPEPGPDVDSVKLPGTRWASLRQAYPSPDPAYPQWALPGFPEPARAELDRRLSRSFDRGVAHVHRLIRASMSEPPPGKDNPKGWREVAGRLGELPYQDWGKLLTLVARLRNPKAVAPLAELSEFLARERFTITLHGFTLAVPDDLRTQRAFPAGKLTITVNAAPGTAPRTLTFRQDGSAQRGNAVTTFRFVGEGEGTFAFRPGDVLTAELPMRAGPEEFNLVWFESRSEVYSFERLTREPRLARPGLPPEPASRVRLMPDAETVIPAVPALLPGGGNG